ncbi:MAG: hypothetical protein IIB76_01135 [Proteobacteria bacterium]|nr:hypothetical protein [Pseudomonadota bacterium]
MNQVLLNIFINALDAINAKQTEQEHFLEITTGLEGGMVEIRVSDTGIGMSPEVCKRAFESFFTTKEIGKIEDTEFGLFRESERDDVVFEDRHFRLSGARLTSRKTYSDDEQREPDILCFHYYSPQKTMVNN